MTEAERKAVFYKLEHDGPISPKELKKTGLRPVAEPTDRITLARPRTDNLDQFDARLSEFEKGAVNRGMVPNAPLARIQTVAEGDPKDRLSQDLFEKYDELIRADWVTCEIELMSFQAGANQKRDELQAFRHALMQEFRSGVAGNLFEHEETKGACRAVIRCTGQLFRRLVEAPEWRERIFWFEARPEFQHFFTVADNFNVEQLGSFSTPPEDAPVVCVVDSGVTIGNPFLQPVTKEELVRSFLRAKPNNPSDEYQDGQPVSNPECKFRTSSSGWV